MGQVGRVGQVGQEDVMLRRLKSGRGQALLETLKPDEVARWVLLIEGSDADIVGRACGEALTPKILEARGAEPGPVMGLYALHHVVEA